MAAALLAAGLGGAAAMPATASAAVVPFAAGVGPLAGGTTEIFHTCKVMGHAVDGFEAVHCADLFRTQGVGTGPTYTAENEVFCQSTGGTLVECAAITERPEIAIFNLAVGPPQPPSSAATPGPVGTCGARLGHSPCGVRRVINAAPSITENDATFQCSIWAVTTGDKVVLPRSDVTVTAPNLATPHATIPC